MSTIKNARGSGEVVFPDYNIKKSPRRLCAVDFFLASAFPNVCEENLAGDKFSFLFFRTASI